MEENCDRKEKKVCLNCGTGCEGKYCPNCGQSTAVGRLTAKNLALYCSAGLLRVNSTFFKTIGALLWHPWVVIGEFIRGKRVRYTPPFVLLVLLVFYDLLFTKWLGLKAVRDEVFLSQQPDMLQAVDKILRFFADNETITALILMLPLLLAVRLAYRKAGARRYNWVEYMFAGVFVLCILYSVDVIALPMQWLWGWSSSQISWTYSMAIGSVALFKVFGGPVIKSIRRLMLFFFYSIVFGLTYLTIIGSIIFSAAMTMTL